MTGNDFPRVAERPASHNLTHVPLLEIPGWDEFGVVAGITERVEGFSLGLNSPEPAATITANWRAFRAAMRPRFTAFVLGLQCHDTEIAVHDRPSTGWTVLDDIDGHVTGAPGLLLTVTVADCVPCYLAHPGTGTLGLLHAGWRGTAKGIIEKGISALATRASCSSGEILIHFGVSVCESCYEVGSEVARQVSGTVPEGATHLNLRRELALRARALGVRQITMSTWCTAHDGRRFHSHRRDGSRAGRGIAYLGRPRGLEG